MVTVGVAQCSSKAQKSIDKAKSTQYTDAEESIKWLTKALGDCPSSEEAAFILADLYFQRRDFQQVKDVLEQLLSHHSNTNPKVHFFLAEAQRELFLFKQAAVGYQKYLDSDAKSRKLRILAARNKAHALFSQTAYENQENIEFTSMSSQINSQASEYLPIMTADESKLVFTRRVHASEDAFFSERLADDSWSQPHTLAGLPVQYRKAAVSFSVDGKMLVLAMADYPNGIGSFDLYFMEYADGEWSQPINFGKQVNTPGWESQPCISADGSTVFFSTDRKGGEGGNDIWKTKRNSDGSWSAPTNLGLEINGPENEESPFIHRDQRTLYFRSDGHPGLGSFDIFMSRMIRFKKWTTPLNLGYPVNSVGNDGSLFVSLDGVDAYIASNIDHLQMSDYKNQIDQQHTDIYKFELAQPYRPIPTTYIKLNFIDKVLRVPIQPHVELIDFNSGDTLYFGKTDHQGEVLLCLPQQSQYSLTSVLANYLPHFERFEPDETTWGSEPLIKEIALQDKAQKTETGIAEPIILRNVLFDTDAATLKAGSYLELNKLIHFLNENKNLKIELRGHTDNVGDEAHNLDLSLRRARAIYDYLIDHNIEASRLSYQGLGETQPLGDNATEAGRQMNRRTEFIILN
jgi:outer membrane protein OmpA-like peptidoglycan-associated protein